MLKGEISLGDIVTLLVVTGSIGWNYVSQVRRIDRHSQHLQSHDSDIEDLRCLRGLKLEHAPYRIQECFGFRRVHSEK